MNTNHPLRTICNNYRQLTKFIPGGDLPRTFIDAALVCAKLSIRYIWIDSLCIIQVSREDSRHEAAWMHLVYRSALTTIAATPATSCHDGLLKQTADAVPAVKIAYSINHPGQRGADTEQSMVVCHFENPEDSCRTRCEQFKMGHAKLGYAGAQSLNAIDSLLPKQGLLRMPGLFAGRRQRARG